MIAVSVNALRVIPRKSCLSPGSSAGLSPQKRGWDGTCAFSRRGSFAGGRSKPYRRLYRAVSGHSWVLMTWDDYWSPKSSLSGVGQAFCLAGDSSTPAIFISTFEGMPTKPPVIVTARKPRPVRPAKRQPAVLASVIVQSRKPGKAPKTAPDTPIDPAEEARIKAFFARVLVPPTPYDR